MARRAGAVYAADIVSGLGPPTEEGDDPATAAVLDATGDLLAAYGFGRWTMDDVAERCGLGRATVYRRFEGRGELVRATLARDARRFFEAVATSVDGVAGFEEKVVAGFIFGLRLFRSSLVARLLENDPAAAAALLTSGSLLAAGRSALVDRYEAMTGVRLRRAARHNVEAAAETLVRLGLSFALMPESAMDPDDGAARTELKRVVRALLSTG